MRHGLEELAIRLHLALEHVIARRFSRLACYQAGLLPVVLRRHILAVGRAIVLRFQAPQDIGALRLNGGFECLDLRLDLLHLVMRRFQYGREVRRLLAQVRQLHLVAAQRGIVEHLGRRSQDALVAGLFGHALLLCFGERFLHLLEAALFGAIVF